MSKETPTETPPWAYPGFERDFKVFLLSLSEKAISRTEYRNIMRATGVPLGPEPDPRSLTLETPSLDRPTLNAPHVQLPDLYLVPGNEGYGFDPNSGFVYDLETGGIVGQLEPGDFPEDEEPSDETLEPGDPGDLPPDALEPPPPPPEDEQIDDA